MGKCKLKIIGIQITLVEEERSDCSASDVPCCIAYVSTQALADWLPQLEERDMIVMQSIACYIMLICPCNVYPLTPHFYIVKQRFTGVFIFSYFCSKNKLWVLFRTEAVLTCTHNLCFEQK